jgi:hypothetical protein
LLFLIILWDQLNLEDPLILFHLLHLYLRLFLEILLSLEGLLDLLILYQDGLEDL